MTKQDRMAKRRQVWESIARLAYQAATAEPPEHPALRAYHARLALHYDDKCRKYDDNLTSPEGRNQGE